MANFGSVINRFHKLLGGQSASSDGELLARFARRQDQDAFAVLVERHGPMVYRVCLRVVRNPHDAEDAFQATFVILARKAGRLREGSLAPWLHTVARNTALDARRRGTLNEPRSLITGLDAAHPWEAGRGPSLEHPGRSWLGDRSSLARRVNESLAGAIQAPARTVEQVKRS